MNYIINDNLGLIANAHLVWADKSEKGAECDECLQLAALHSTAVDFCKSGVPAKFPKVRCGPMRSDTSCLSLGPRCTSSRVCFPAQTRVRWGRVLRGFEGPMGRAERDTFSQGLGMASP